MLEITPTTDVNLLTAYCKKCGKLPDPAFYLYIAKDRDVQLAAGLFEIFSDSVEVVFYHADETDPHLFDAILRAGLNYAAEHGIKTGRLPETFRQEHAERFHELNYPDWPEFDITNFFKKYKYCK
ncbi:MAG: hypothetical protein FWE32_11840 [Oscillospiraceae bacterium]|nr:hypothetical protein [Oscillospiraceae bacterium]